MVYALSVIIYLVALIGVAMWWARRTREASDFMVAGRRLPTAILVGTLVATWTGSGSLLAGGGLAYHKGFSALWFSLGVWVAMIVLYLVAGRVRRFAQFTVADILETRYAAPARVLGTLVIIVAYTAIASYQFRAGGIVLELVAGIPQQWGILLTAAFVIVYTALAGMLSVAYTDVINGVVMLAGLALGLPFLLSAAGGWGEVRAALPATHFSLLGTMSLREALGYSLPTMLLVLGESNMYQRFYAARSETAARRSVLGWIGGTVMVETLIISLAVVGSALYSGIEAESVILYAARHGLPLVIGCVVLTAAVAVIVSTADSFLLVPATSIMRDVGQRFLWPRISERRLLIYSRVAVVVLGIIAYLQVSFFTTVLRMAIYAYTMYGVGITPALLAAFFWKRATAAGGIASMGGGMVMTLAWEIAGHPGGVETVYPALASSLVLLIAVSLATPAPPRRSWEPFAG